ncbi:MAG: cysteine--tRNA ligase [Bacteroidales bacterium]|nr:cysteine--tRNA ligase [Bacteroidales bacterium]
MGWELFLYNSLSRKKEKFEPINPPHVGMYVCGPTVYGDPHLGHARPAITFDVLFRLLQHLGYKVRYVRNITDVGHLENDADEGEDKIEKKARIEQLEPMEVVQFYTNRYRKFMEAMNVLPPNIEPQASGHIIEQQQLIDRILTNGFAYENEGSIYFDVVKYHQQHHYGKLSGRVLEELQNQTRRLEGQEYKRNPVDFALWKKATPTHIMRWPSKWGEGYPGWHLECSAMSYKYLGEKFDIHGGGMDLIFPHHECEIAQTVAAFGHESVKYWVHNNLITINGQKMGKSLGNFITLEELFTGNHHLLEQAYSPMTIRFFILTAHYRSTLDFSNPALQSAAKALKRLFNAKKLLANLPVSTKTTFDLEEWKTKCFEAICDDLNTALLISHLMDLSHFIHAVYDGKATITDNDKKDASKYFMLFVENILGLKEEAHTDNHTLEIVGKLVEMIQQIRLQAKANKDYETSDRIRQQLSEIGIEVRDRKDGYEWSIKE